MKWLSLFSGIGGFDLALQRQGDEVVAACEIDKYAQQIYRKHFPNIPIYDDARKINPRELPDFEGICAGFPCQAFSIAGKRKGFEDDRGNLFLEIARIAKERKPRILLLENVKGLLSHDKGRTYRIIRDTLDEMGYTIEWQLLNSKYFVPQNRERIIIVCHLRGKCSRKVFPIGEDNKKPIGEIKKIIGYSESGSIYNIDGIYPSITSGSHGYSMGNIAEPKIKYYNKSDSQADRIYDIDGIGPTLGVGNAMSKPTIAIPFMIRNKNMNGRRQKNHNEPTFTIDTTNSAGIFDGYRIRRLTPLECERLQSFPDGYTEGLSDTQRYKCLGNAVTVDVVEYLVKKL